MTTPLQIQTSADGSLEVHLTGIWTVAQAAELHQQIDDAIRPETAWELHTQALEVADLAIWQILHRLSRRAPQFTLPTPSPCLDRLSEELGLPKPCQWASQHSNALQS